MATRLAHALLLLTLFSACSFSLDRSHSQVTINVAGQSSPLELFPGASMFMTTPPASSSLFDCLVINVVGPGIAPSVGPQEQLLFLPGLYTGSSCTYPGVSAIVPNSGQSKITLRVPTGPRRIIQVGGVINGSSNMCSNTSIQPVANGGGLAFYELGRTMTDLFRDSAVQVSENWNQIPATEQTERLMTCSPGGDDYLSLIQGTSGLLSFWPLYEQTGATAFDLQSGTNPGAVGNMTLANVTSVSDGPPGIGFPAINAGANGISTSTGASFGTGNFSVEFWIRYSGGCEDDDGALFVMRHSGSGLIRFKCNVSEGVLFEVQDNAAAPFAVASTSNNGTPLNDGQWHHIAGVKQGNSIYLYVDAGTPTTGSAAFSGNFNFTNSPLTQIGQDTVYGTYQPADYAMVAIYTQALTMAQVTDHMLAGN